MEGEERRWGAALTRNEVKKAKKAPKPRMTEYPTPWLSTGLPPKKLLARTHSPIGDSE